MNESDQNVEGLQGEKDENSCTDSYKDGGGGDAYTMSDIVEAVPAEGNSAAEETDVPSVVVDTHGLFSGSRQQNREAYNEGFHYPGAGYDGQPPCGGGQPCGGYDGQDFAGNQAGGYGEQQPGGGQFFYGNQNPCGGPNVYGNQSGAYGEPPYYDGKQPYNGQNPYGDQNGYGSQQPYNGQNGYGNQQPYNDRNGYGSQQPYNGQNGYGNQQPYNDRNGYGNQQPYNDRNPYGNQQPYNGQNPYGNQQPYNGQNPYGNQNGYGNQGGYGNRAGGNFSGPPPFGGQPPYNNPYSPYAAPPQKQHTGLIIGIVAAIVILLLIAAVALAHKAVNIFSGKARESGRHGVYDFDYDDDYDYDHHDDGVYDYGDDYDYFDYDDDYGFYDYDDDYPDEEYDDRYYVLHQDIKDGLSYQMGLEEYEYETDYDNVFITATIPVISGENVPNLDKLNGEIRKQVDLVTELFEKDYEARVKEDEDNYFGASLVGYVTYMDEDKLSIAYQEELYNDLGGGVYLISINVDMKSGVILKNEDMLTVDDAFSVDFRRRNDEQNGEVPYLTYMTDQQITEYFNSDNIIVFYTPKGMEIGFNYEEGWVTVTYADYEQYLKVF